MTMTLLKDLRPQTKLLKNSWIWRLPLLRHGSHHESHAGYPEDEDVDGVSNSLSSIEDEDSISPSLELVKPAASWWDDDDSSSLCFSEATPPSLLLETDTPMRPAGDSSAEQCCSYFEHASTSSDARKADEEPPSSSSSSFLVFRLNYLLVTLVIMLSDGLQGTHLYVLYEGYGFSVASLYCLGFITGAVTAPVTGALVDKFGRKKAALLYCFLEIGINLLEQYPFLPGLIISRMVGGVTTNLLSSVFETWLDTEYRRREFDPDKYEDLMRDSMVVRNMAAIASGYLAHVLSERFGPVGPFEGAVACTAIALVVVAAVWTENYGSAKEERDSKSFRGYIRGAIHTFKSDNRVLRVCIIQGLSLGAVMIFIFVWVPTLQTFAKIAPTGSMGLDGQHEPAYGLIFGAFMAAGVVGGLCSCYVRKAVTVLLSPLKDAGEPDSTVTIEGEGEVRPMAVEFLAAVCYMLSAVLFLVPCLFTESNSSAFTCCIWAFVTFEFLLGVYSPCEGVIRSLYIPSDCRASIMTLPSIIVNVAVSIGVASTNVISLQTAFKVVALLMVVAAVLQLSLISKREWDSFFGRVDRLQKRAFKPVRTLSFSATSTVNSAMGKTFNRSTSMPVVPSDDAHLKYE